MDIWTRVSRKKQNLWWKNFLKYSRISFITLIFSSTFEKFPKFGSLARDSSLILMILFQEISFKLVKHWLSVGIEGHIELHLLVRGVAVTIHHVMEVLADAKSLSHALRRWLNIVVECGGIHRRVLVPLRLSMLHQSSSLWKHTNHIFSFFSFIFFHPHNFNFFLSKHKILKIKEF